MKDMKEIRFIATNYYNLQGLRLVPLGFLLLYVSYWANNTRYPVEPIGFIKLIGVIVIVILAALAIDFYYKKVFGEVKQTCESRRLETQLWTIGALLATLAFWLDVSFKLPLSLIGLVAAFALIADYIRMTWLIKGHFLIYYPGEAIILIIVSLLPPFGLTEWWHLIGLRAQMFGITLLLGLFTVMAGVLSHLFLAKSFRRNQETQ